MCRLEGCAENGSGARGATGLSVDGAAIAAALTLREGTALCLPKVAYDPPWGKYHPGRTL